MSLGETLVGPRRIDFPGYWKLHQSRFRPPINKLSARRYDGPTGGYGPSIHRHHRSRERQRRKL